MHIHPRYTDVANLKYVENSYTVSEGALSFAIPAVNADKRIVNLTIEWKANEPPLQIRLPFRWKPYQKLTLNLNSRDITTEAIRELEVVRKNTPLSLAYVPVGRVMESEGDIVVRQLHFKTLEDGKWIPDYTFNSTEDYLSSITNLVVRGALETTQTLNTTYTPVERSFNGKPQFISQDGIYIRYDALDGWCLADGSDEMLLAATSNDHDSYPWEPTYQYGATIQPRELSRKRDNTVVSSYTYATSNQTVPYDVPAARENYLTISSYVLTETPVLRLPKRSNGALAGDRIILKYQLTGHTRPLTIQYYGYGGSLSTLLSLGGLSSSNYNQGSSVEYNVILTFNGTETWSVEKVNQHSHYPEDIRSGGSGMTNAPLGYVLTADGAGKSTWAAPTGGGGGFTWGTVPASPTSTGTAGQMAYADNYLYVCVATNTWKRTILATW